MRRNSPDDSGGMPFDLDDFRTALRVRLGDFAEGDVGSLQVFLQALDRAVCVGIDGVIHLDLKDQVGATLQIESQMNALLQRCQQTLRRKALGMPKMPNRKTISTAIIRMVLARRFLFMRNSNPVKTSGDPPESLR